MWFSAWFLTLFTTMLMAGMLSNRARDTGRHRAKHNWLLLEALAATAIALLFLSTNGPLAVPSAVTQSALAALAWWMWWNDDDFKKRRRKWRERLSERVRHQLRLPQPSSAGA